MAWSRDSLVGCNGFELQVEEVNRTKQEGRPPASSEVWLTCKSTHEPQFRISEEGLGEQDRVSTSGFGRHS